MTSQGANSSDTVSDIRQHQLRRWAEQVLRIHPDETASVYWQVVSGDASFRRFFRIRMMPESRSLIAMDSPPERENNAQFIALSALLRRQGLLVPEVFAADLEQGFLLVEDLGDALYGNIYEGPDRDQALSAALDSLIRLQRLDQGPAAAEAARLIPPYDAERLGMELDLFREWLLERLLGLTLPDGTVKLLRSARTLLIDNALSQPQVPVHRDFHSRNLLWCDGRTALVDFQDALRGPLSYDLASLLRDCYVRFPEAEIQRWREDYLERLGRSGILTEVPDAHTFARQFDRMAIQRQLKAVGIFARLKLRDAKPGYLADIPVVLRYLVDLCLADAELNALGHYLAEQVVPVADIRIQQLISESTSEPTRT